MFFNSTKTNTLMNASVQATAMLLGALGFEPAPRSTIPARLSHLSPSGGTSLRDSVKAGLSMILQLNSALEQLGSMEVWNFVHIVITDGEDSGSQTSVEALALLFLMINQAIPTSRCSTAYIGIDLNQRSAQELVVLKTFGGDSCQAYNVANVDLESIFERISLSLGIQNKIGVVGVSDGNSTAAIVVQQRAPVLQVRRNKFAVLLNLDFSGSMSGSRWNSLKNSVGMFLSNMQEGDLVSCLLFNDKVQLLNQIPIYVRAETPVNNRPAIVQNQTGSRTSSAPVQNSIPKKKKKKCEIF